MKYLSILAVPAFLTLAIGAHAAHLANPNLLVDSSFEGTLTFDGPPFAGSWEGFSSDGTLTNPAPSFTTTMPRTGPQSLDLLINNVANGFTGVFQDVNFGTSLVGTQAWFSGWHSLVGDAGGSEIRIEWRDSVLDTEISRLQVTPSAAVGVYEEFVLSEAIPAGADSARLVYAIQSFGAAQDQQVFVDDLNFNIAGVPEPSAGVLLGLSLCGLILRRKR